MWSPVLTTPYVLKSLLFEHTHTHTCAVLHLTCQLFSNVNQILTSSGKTTLIAQPHKKYLLDATVDVTTLYHLQFVSEA